MSDLIFWYASTTCSKMQQTNFRLGAGVLAYAADAARDASGVSIMGHRKTAIRCSSAAFTARGRLSLLQQAQVRD
jgi:hypothetical protein